MFGRFAYADRPFYFKAKLKQDLVLGNLKKFSKPAIMIKTSFADSVIIF